MFPDTYIYIPYDDESGGGKKRKKAKAEPEMTIEYTDTLDDTMKDWSIPIFVCDHLLKASTCFRRRLQKAAEISKDGTAMLHKKSDSYNPNQVVKDTLVLQMPMLYYYYSERNSRCLPYRHVV